MSSTIQAERDNIHFESDLLKFYIKSDIKKDLISNVFFVKKARKKRTTADCKSLKHYIMATASYYQAESDFCFSASNLLLEKYKGQIETKFSASYHQMRIAIC